MTTPTLRPYRGSTVWLLCGLLPPTLVSLTFNWRSWCCTFLGCFPGRPFCNSFLCSSPIKFYCEFSSLSWLPWLASRPWVINDARFLNSWGMSGGTDRWLDTCDEFLSSVISILGFLWIVCGRAIVMPLLACLWPPSVLTLPLCPFSRNFLWTIWVTPVPRWLICARIFASFFFSVEIFFALCASPYFWYSLTILEYVSCLWGKKMLSCKNFQPGFSWSSSSENSVGPSISRVNSTVLRATLAIFLFRSRSWNFFLWLFTLNPSKSYNGVLCGD